MASADSVLNTIKLEDIYALGNAWIKLGDELHERRTAVDSDVAGMTWTGAAGNGARLAWTDATAKNLDDAIETAWTVGQTINRYADKLHEAAEEYAKKLNAMMWADILGALLGAVFFYLGPLLESVLAMIGQLIARLIPVIASMAGRLGPIGSAVVGSIGGAVIGSASGLAFDLGVGAAGAAIAHTDYDIDWGAEALTLGIGGGFGGIAGGLGGYHGVPKPGSPGGVPAGSPPVKTPPVPKTDRTGDADSVVGGGKDNTFNPPPPQTRRGGNESPAGSGGTPPPVKGGVSVNDSAPTSSGPAGGNRTHDVGMPPPPAARAEGAGRATGTPAPLTNKAEIRNGSYSGGERTGGEGTRSTPPPTTAPRQSTPDGTPEGGSQSRPVPVNRVAENTGPHGDRSGPGGNGQDTRAVPPPATSEHGVSHAGPPARDPGGRAPAGSGDRVQNDVPRRGTSSSREPVGNQGTRTAPPVTEPARQAPGGEGAQNSTPPRAGGRGADSLGTAPPAAERPGGTNSRDDDTNRSAQRAPAGGHSERIGDQGAVPKPPAHGNPAERVRTGDSSDHLAQPPANRSGEPGGVDDPSRQSAGTGGERRNTPVPGGGSRDTTETGPGDAVPRASRPAPGDQPVAPPPARRPDADGRTQQPPAGERPVTGTSRTGDGHESHSAPPPRGDRRGSDTDGSGSTPLRESPGWSRRRVDRMWEDARDSGLSESRTRALYDDWADARVSGDKAAENKAASAWFDAVADARVEKQLNGMRDHRPPRTHGQDDTSSSAAPRPGDGRGTGGGDRDGHGRQNTGGRGRDGDGQNRPGEPYPGQERHGAPPLKESPGWSRRRLDAMWEDARGSGLSAARTRELHDDWVRARATGDSPAENKAATAWFDALRESRAEQQAHSTSDHRTPHPSAQDGTSSSPLPKPVDRPGNGGDGRGGAAHGDTLPDGSRSGGAPEAGGAGRGENGGGGNGPRTSRTGYGDDGDDAYGGRDGRAGRDDRSGGDGLDRSGRSDGDGHGDVSRRSPGGGAPVTERPGNGRVTVAERERPSVPDWLDSLGKHKRDALWDQVHGARDGETGPPAAPARESGPDSAGRNDSSDVPPPARDHGTPSGTARREAGEETPPPAPGRTDDPAPTLRPGSGGDRSGVDREIAERVANRTPEQFGDVVRRHAERNGMSSAEAGGWAKQGERAWAAGGDLGRFRERFDQRVEELGAKRHEGTAGATTPPARDEPTSAAPVTSRPAPQPTKEEGVSALPSGHGVYEGMLRDHGLLKDGQGVSGRARDEVYEEHVPAKPSASATRETHAQEAVRSPATETGQRERIAGMSPDEWGRAMERHARGQGLDAREAARFGAAYREARMEGDARGWQRVEESVASRLLDHAIEDRVANRSPEQWSDLVRRFAERHGMSSAEAGGWAKQAERAWAPGGDIARFRERFDQRVEELATARITDDTSRTPSPVATNGEDAGASGTGLPAISPERAGVEAQRRGGGEPAREEASREAPARAVPAPEEPTTRRRDTAEPATRSGAGPRGAVDDTVPATAKPASPAYEAVPAVVKPAPGREEPADEPVGGVPVVTYPATAGPTRHTSNAANRAPVEDQPDTSRTESVETADPSRGEPAGERDAAPTGPVSPVREATPAPPPPLPHTGAQAAAGQRPVGAAADESVRLAPQAPGQSSSSGRVPGIIREWVQRSGGGRRSEELRAVDRAVRRLQEGWGGPNEAALRDRVTHRIAEWRATKSGRSSRDEAVRRLRREIEERSAQPAAGAAGSSRRRSPRDLGQRSAAPLLPSPEHTPQVEGFAPARGFEAEVHLMRVAVPRDVDHRALGTLVSVDGLLDITIDHVGEHAVLEIVSRPARALAGGQDDGRAEPRAVATAFLDALHRIAHAPRTARFPALFPASHGYTVDMEAEELWLQEHPSTQILVHHTVAVPVAGYPALLRHVLGRMRPAAGPVLTAAHEDGRQALLVGEAGGSRFAEWLRTYPEWAEAATASDMADLVGALTLGYAQVASAFRGRQPRTNYPKDWTAATSRESLAAVRASLGAAPRAFLEHQAATLAGVMGSALGYDGDPLTQRLRDVGLGPRPTLGEYLDNLLRESPARPVDQYESHVVRSNFDTLDSNPDGWGRPRIVPAAVRVEVRSYAPVDSRDDDVLEQSDTLAGVALETYNEARAVRGLPPVGYAAYPAPPAPVLDRPRRVPATETPRSGPVPVPAPGTGRVLPATLAELADTLPGLSASERDARLGALAPGDRSRLVADPGLVRAMRERLDDAAFRELAADWLVVVPDGVHDPEEARAEARRLVEEMTADADVAEALLTTGRHLLVVPRDVPFTDVDAFRGLRGSDGRSLRTARGGYARGRAGVPEENLLGEPAAVHGAGTYADGYSSARHEWAHAVESVLDPADRQRIEDVFHAKRAAQAAGETVHWPDGAFPNYSSSDPHEYFAQLTTAYHAANAGIDELSGARRNNGADWVERHDSALLPLLQRLYGPGRPAARGGLDNPLVLSAFRAFWTRVEETPSPTPLPDSSAVVAHPLTPRGGTEGTAWHPAPPTGDGSAARAAIDPRMAGVLRRAFGEGVEASGQFPGLYTALHTLVGAHQATPRLTGTPFDFDSVVRRLLRVAPGQEVGPQQRMEALQTVSSAARAGWSGDLPSLVAYRVGRMGAFGPASVLTDASGTFLGRNFTGRTGLVLDADSVLAPGEDNRLHTARGPWSGTRPHVAVAERDEEGGDVLVAVGNGDTVTLDEAEFAALVGADPRRDPNAAVVVGVGPRPRDTSEVLTRLVADAAGTRAWGVTRPYRLQPVAEGIRAFAFPPVADGEMTPVGLWVPADPGLVPGPGSTIQAADATMFADEDLSSYPILTADGQELAGRAHLDEADVARREEALRHVSEMLYYYDDLEPIPGLTSGASGPLLLLPRGLSGSYVSIGHGERGRVVLPRRGTGANHAVPARELGGVLARRPSVRRLAPDVPLWLLWCEIAMVRPGADPLTRPAAAQEVANRTGHPVLASDAAVAIEEAHGDNPPRVVKTDDPARPRYSWYQFLPEPDSRRLDAFADLAGMAADTARRTTRVLRWIRALRLVQGFDIDTRPERQDEFLPLLTGFGTLERLRLSQGAGPLGWRELEVLTHAEASRSGAEPGPVNPDTLRAVLDAANTGTLRLPAPSRDEDVRQAPPAPDHPAAHSSEEALLAPPTPPAPSRETPAGSGRVADIVRMYEEMSRRVEEHEAATTPPAPEEDGVTGTETPPRDGSRPVAERVTGVPATVREVPATARGGESPAPARKDEPPAPGREAPARVTPDAYLEERGLTPVHILPTGDTTTHLLTAVAPAETSALARGERPVTPSELRERFADELAAELALPEARRTLALPAEGPHPGVPLLPGAEPDALVAGMRTGTGPAASEWLALAVAGPVLGLRVVVLLPDGRAWAAGPREGREVVLLHTPDPAPHTSRWVATERAGAAREAARTTPPPPAVRPAPAKPSPAPTVPETFFGIDPRPVPAPLHPAGTAPLPRPEEAAPAPGAAPRVIPAREVAPAAAGTAPGTRTSTRATEGRTPTEAGTSRPSEEATSGRTHVPPAEEAAAEETETRTGPREEAATTETTETPATTEITGTLPAFSPYIQAYGARHDGSVGFVAWELPSAEVLSGLRGQIVAALPMDADDTRETVRAHLNETLGSAEIAENLPRIRGSRGHRMTVRVGEVTHTVDIRLRLTTPRPDPRTGITRNLPRTRRLERQSEGVQALTSTQGSGTSRTFSLPYVALPQPASGPVRWIAVTVTPNVTMRQRTLNVGLSESLSVKVLQRAGDDAGAVRFDGVWQVRVDGAADSAEGWGPEHVHGPMHLWFPGNRIGAEGTAAPLPRAAGLDTFPLWGIDDVLDTDLRPAQIIEHPQLPGLRALGEGSRHALEGFLDEQMNRGSLHLQRDRGVMSPLLTDDEGTALGLLRVRAVVTPGEPTAQTADGDKSLELRFTHTTGTERTARSVSGAGLTVNVAPTFTPSTAAGHPGAEDRWGGRVYAKFLGSWQSGDTFSTTSKAGLMHGLTASSGQLLTPAAVVYEFTLLRAGGGTQGPVRVERGGESVQLRLLPEETAAGAPPTDEEARVLPAHLDALAAIGYTAVPLALEGVDEIFDRAETRLRELRYLPPLAHQVWEGRLQDRRARAQLTNLQRFEQLRSRIGRAAALPDAVEGGRSLWLELPTTAGTTRAELRLGVTRDRVPRAGDAGAPAARHELRLPGIGTTATGSHEARGTRERSTAFGGGAGFGGGPRQPAGNWSVDYGFDGVANRTWAHAASSGSAIATEQAVGNPSDGTEIFSVPARVALDLYEGTSPEPVARFAEPPAPRAEPLERITVATDPEEDVPGLDVPPGTETAPLRTLAPRPATTGAEDTEEPRTEEDLADSADETEAPPPVQAPPGTVTATVRLAVTHHRTEPDPGRAPATGSATTTGTEAPAAPREVPEVPAYTIRAPRTGPGQDNDRFRLGLVDAEGNPLPGITRLPDDATADIFRATEAIQEALRLVAAETYPGRPAPGVFGRVTAAASRGAAVLPVVSSAVAHLAGQDPRDWGAFANESAYQQVRVASLLARAHQILNGVYTAEGIVLPGLGADRHLAVDVEGYLHHPAVRSTFPVSGQSDVNATDLATTRRTRSSAVTGNAELTALRAAPRPTPQGTVARIIQGNVAGTLSRAHRDEHFDDIAATSATTRGGTEGAGQHLVTTDLTLLLTVRRGTANVLGNAVGIGSEQDITLAIDLPGAVQFRLSPTQLLREARWFTGIEGIDLPAVPETTVSPPDDFARTRTPGFGAVLAVTPLDDAITRRLSRDRLGREAARLVERVAPGVTRPGHIAHLPGVASRIADLTASPGLRALVARGSVSLWFRYGARADARLVELTLVAETEAQTPALREVRGRPGAEKTGVEQQSTHAPGNTIESDTVSRVVTGLLDLGLRAPRGRSRYIDRWSALPSASRTHALTRRSDHTADERFWQRTDSVADFDRVGYRLTASVRTTLISTDVFELLGGLLGGSLTAVAHRGERPLLEAVLDGFLRGVPPQESTVPADVALRFASADTRVRSAGEGTAPTGVEWTPLRPRVNEEDPRLAPAAVEGAEASRTLRTHPRFVPTGTTPLSHFNAFPELAEAIRAVAPGVEGHWGLTADSNPDAANARLTELAHAGRGAALTAPGTAAGLHPRMPGSWPLSTDNASHVSLQVDVYDPRPFTPAASDVAADSARNSTRVDVSTASSSQGLELGQRFALSADRGNRHVPGGSQPLFSAQPVTRSTDSNVTTGGQYRVKTGTASAGDTYTHLAHADAVVTVTGPRGIRYVTGSVTLRAGERDLLGYGVVSEPSQPWAYDMDVLLRRQRPSPATGREEAVAAPRHEAADSRAWIREPVTELPRLLASGLAPEPDGAQLWVDVGEDPDGSVLGRALYVGIRVAEIAHRRVELAVRGATGLRFWPIEPDGSLSDVTATTREGWEELRTAGSTYTAETEAEAMALAEQQPLEARLDGLRANVARTEGESERLRIRVEAARTSYEEAQSAENGARTRRGDTAGRLTEGLRAVATAETEVEEAEESLRASDERVLRARAAAVPAPDGTPAPDAAVDALRAAEQLQREALRAWGSSEGALRASRAEVARLTERLESLQAELRAAEGITESSRLALQELREDHRRAVQRRGEAARSLDAVVEELRRLRQEQREHRALAQRAWQSLAGLAGRLSADRCAELTGGSGFPLDTLTPGPRGR
ncbi:hypothetical protein STTU_0993 [Streptomyces sp. Tu6071]|uniref:hypothetical protein n=1 Tax=Streptomyces sp. Tu6071 TaxID=355249 RepID=UPI00020E6E62|nr:hypothetical protein [Streptomyces sp. Tu6071]EGJ73782.1 hypothetical protein STTU_0993 [Streptomyces sp. Tu6071]